MEKVIPQKLYKYQSLASGSYTLDNLRKSHIWLSKPNRLNDPFDLSIPFRYPDHHQEYQELYDLIAERWRAVGEVNNIKEMESQYLANGKVNLKFIDEIKASNTSQNRKKITDVFSKMGVACFTETFDNILMW